MTLRTIGWLAPLLLVLACTGLTPTATPTTPPTALPSPSANPPTPTPPTCCRPAPATATSAASPTSALTAIPTELQGTWRATAADGAVTLTLEATSYRVLRTGERGQGSVYANGDLLQFSNGTLCALIGTYSWSITDGTLVMHEKTEACPGRLPSLNGLAYTRLE